MPKLEDTVAKSPLFKRRVAGFNITEKEDHRRLLRAYVAVVKDELVRRGGNEFGTDYEDGKNALYEVYARFLNEGRFPLTENEQIPLDATDRFKKTYQADLESLTHLAQGIRLEPAGAEYAVASAYR